MDVGIYGDCKRCRNLGGVLSNSLPDFLVVGAMKAGTTSLFNYLIDHPQIWMPWNKEVDYFSNDTNWNRGQDWYLGHFSEAAVELAGETPGEHASDGSTPGVVLAVGEASPNYSKRHLFPQTVDRIRETLATVKVIYIVRDPVARLQSMYVDMLAYGGEERSIDEAVSADDDYVLTSCYGYQVQPYVEAFGVDRIHVLTSQELRQHRVETTAGVYRFLGVDDAFVSPRLASEANPRSEKQIGTETGDRINVDLSESLLAELNTRFAEDRALLSATLGFDPFA